MVDSNLAVREQRSLVYSIIDSEIPMDELGNMVGKCKWHGYGDVDITVPEKQRRGPAPSAERDQAHAVLVELFAEKRTWFEPDVSARLAERGVQLSGPTLRKITRDLGIRREPIYQRGERGIRGWRWTTEKASVAEAEAE